MTGALFLEAPATRRGPLPWLLALGAGLAQAASLAWPGPGFLGILNGQPLWWLQILSLALLGRVLLGAGSARRAALLGWLFATSWLVGTFWWLFISMHTYGGLAAPLAALAVLALAAFLGSYYAAVSALFWRVAPNCRALAAIVFAALWLLAELARGQWWTGFPWGAGGYAHVDGPLAVLARSVGVYGMGFVAAALAMGLAQWAPGDLRRRAAGPLAPAAARLGGPGLAAPLRRRGLRRAGRGAQKPVRHAVAGQYPAGREIPARQRRTHGAAVVPRPAALGRGRPGGGARDGDPAAAPATGARLPGGDRRALHPAGKQALLLGIPLGNLEQGYTNSVLGFAPGLQPPYRYDKHHLVPFGEFIPPLFRWFTEMMNIPLGDFNRGAVGQPSLPWAGERIAPNICYEDLFGEELGARFRDPDSAPTIMANMSNIGWFGDTVAIDQHLAISRLRALEFERPMLRATNTGATAVIDHRARVTHRLPAFQRKGARRPGAGARRRRHALCLVGVALGTGAAVGCWAWAWPPGPGCAGAGRRRRQRASPGAGLCRQCHRDTG